MGERFYDRRHPNVVSVLDCCEGLKQCKECLGDVYAASNAGIAGTKA